MGGAVVLPPRLVSYYYPLLTLLTTYFSPLSTFVCPTELIAFSDRVNEFKKLGTEVLACSTDSKYAHLEWACKPRCEGGLCSMAVPMLADTNHRISKDYGVLKEDQGISYR